MGHEVKADSRSTSTTSIAGSHRRMYFAAVAPPKPPPMTTTRAFEGIAVAQPATERAPASLMKSRRFTASPLLCGEPCRHRVDLRVGIALGDLMHHGRRPLAVAKRAHLGGDVLARQPGERDHVLRDRAAFAAVADGASGGEIAAVFLGICRECSRGERDGDGDGSAHGPSLWGAEKAGKLTLRRLALPRT